MQNQKQVSKLRSNLCNKFQENLNKITKKHSNYFLKNEGVNKIETEN